MRRARSVGARSARLVAVACAGSAAVVGFGVVAGAGPAGASAPAAVAYYTKGGAPAPNVPAGGLYVSQDATALASGLPSLPGTPVNPPSISGPAAISAVRISGVDASQPATLTLKVATGSLAPVAALATISACPIDTAWQPPAGGHGDVAAAPPYNCGDAPSVGRVAADSSAISWLLPAAIQRQPGEFDVALVPSAAATPAPFATAFAAPGPSSVQAATGPPAPTVAVTAPRAEPVTVPPATAAPAFTPSGGDVAPSVGYPAEPAVALPVTPSPAPAAAQSAGSPGDIVANLPVVGGSRAHRIVAFVALAALAAAWWYVGSGATPQPRRLGALTDAAATAGPSVSVQVGGIGRFRGPRAAKARSLR